jgi:hypothetical protein
MILRRSLLVLLTLASLAVAQPGRWSEAKANEWYKAQPWLVGANYNPASAINELEMWQADTFNPQEIDKELAWAAAIGMNTMRVFLHDLLWDADREGYRRRIDQFLDICSKHKIKPMLVLFDSVWNPAPKLGKQPSPKPGIHNSGWVQSPGLAALQDSSQHPRLERYVTGVISAFAKDPRILAWDIWNEPDNLNGDRFGEPESKVALVERLLPRAFAWARSANPSQPLTAGIWKGDWSSHAKLAAIDKIMIENSDVISFHNYNSPDDLETRIKQLKRYNRPLLCTEYMARGNNSTFQGSLPVLKRHNVAAYNWGLVAGKTQTNLPWDSWKQPYVDGREPSVWFHEVFHPDGRPYREEEVDLIRQLTGRGTKAKAAGAR